MKVKKTIRKVAICSSGTGQTYRVPGAWGLEATNDPEDEDSWACVGNFEYNDWTVINCDPFPKIVDVNPGAAYRFYRFRNTQAGKLTHYGSGNPAYYGEPSISALGMWGCDAGVRLCGGGPPIETAAIKINALSVLARAFEEPPNLIAALMKRLLASQKKTQLDATSFQGNP